MSIFNDIYNGFDNYKDLLDYIEGNIFNRNYIKIVKTNDQFYGIAMEEQAKQFIIAKDSIYYKDSYGYIRICKRKDFIQPYKINNSIWINYSNKLYEAYVKEFGIMKLYNIVGNKINIINNPKNCYFNFLISSFIEKDYELKEFEYYDYSSSQNISLMKRDLLNNPYVVSINPFKSKLKVKYNGEIKCLDYKANVITKEENNHIYSYITGFELDTFDIEKNIKDIFNINSLSLIDVILLFKLGSKYIKKLALNDNIELSKDIIDVLISEKCDIKTYLDNLSNKRMNKILSHSPNLIKYISYPTETMIRIAIEYDNINICNINNLTIYMCERLFSEYSECIRYIEKLDLEIQEHFLNKDINNIKYFKILNYDVLNKFYKKININMLKSNVLKREFLKVLNLENNEFQKDSYLLSELEEKYSNIIRKLNDKNGSEILILNPEHKVNIHLEALSNIIKTQSLEIATGFLYSSGLALMNNSIEKLLSYSKEVKMIIGSLREYKLESIINIDKNTAEYINLFIEDGVKVRTYMKRFYHGKMYILSGEYYTAILIGSSNVSNGGFINNFETNIVILASNNSEKVLEFKSYFNNIWDNSFDIEKLDLSKFLNDDTNFKHIDDFNYLDKEFEKNFNYLIEMNPTEIIKEIKTFQGKPYENEYCAFYFKDYNNLLVLDSLKYENAVYIFKEVDDVKEFTKSLKAKDESTDNKKFVDRINHTQDLTHIDKVKEAINKCKSIF